VDLHGEREEVPLKAPGHIRGREMRLELPQINRLERQEGPGRFVHTDGKNGSCIVPGQGDEQAVGREPGGEAGAGGEHDNAAGSAPAEPGSTAGGRLQLLEQRVAALETEVAALKQLVEDLTAP